MTEAVALPLEERSVEKIGKANIDGATIPYLARAESNIVRAEDGTPLFSIFSVSYLRTDVDPATRPLIFAFDGGPGTASVTMHLGLLGPRRAEMAPDFMSAVRPAKIVDNPRWLLDVADVVIIDAVSTGYSRPAPGGDLHRYHGYTADIDATARFIASYLTRYDRWTSPKFILGESYGGMRAAGLTVHLQERFGVHPRGVILFVPILDRGALDYEPGNDMPYIMFLPTLAAVAWYHKRAGQGRDLREYVAEVENFALRDYTSALLRGRRLSDEERAATARRVAEYIGLSPAYVERANLRVSDERFCKELLRDERLVVGRTDARHTGRDRDAAGEYFERDPFSTFFRRGYAPLINSYLAEELGYRSDLEYRVYNPEVLPWKFSDVAENRFVNVSDKIREAISRYPGLKVFLGTGYFDMAIPFLSAENAIDRTLLEPAMNANLWSRRYESGHLLYLDETELAKLSADLKDFVCRATKEDAD